MLQNMVRADFFLPLALDCLFLVQVVNFMMVFILFRSSPCIKLDRYYYKQVYRQAISRKVIMGNLKRFL